MQFADTTLGALYIDPSDGKVLSPSSCDAPVVVNSSLRQFDERVGAVIDMFPFYSRGSSLEKREAVGDRMRSALKVIDAVATEL